MAPETAQSTAVKRTLHVAVPVEKAFQVFTERMGAWWPATHHVGKIPFKDIRMDARAGGRWYEINAEGAEVVWGSVVAWEPPTRVVLGWHLQPDFQFDPDVKKASEGSLEFVQEGPESTRVEFEHRYLERHGENWQKLRDSVGSEGGWNSVMGEFVKWANAKE
jgi:hypothetical protein